MFHRVIKKIKWHIFLLRHGVYVQYIQIADSIYLNHLHQEFCCHVKHKLNAK